MYTPDKSGGLKHGFLHLFAALSYSLQGLATCFRLSLAFRQELLTALLLCAALYYFNKDAEIWLRCLFCWSLVPVAEMINTALEEALDLITKDYSLGVKHAKDMASGAVFILLVGNGALWIWVFGHDILQLATFGV